MAWFNPRNGELIPDMSNAEVFALHWKFYNPLERVQNRDVEQVSWSSSVLEKVCVLWSQGWLSGIWLFRDVVRFKSSQLNFKNCTSPNPRYKLLHKTEKSGTANKKSCATAWISMEVRDPCNSSNYWGVKTLLSPSDPIWWGSCRNRSK